MGISPILCLVLGLLVVQNEAYTGMASYHEFNREMTACGTRHGNEEFITSVSSSFWTAHNTNKDRMCQTLAEVMNPMNKKTIQVMVKDRCTSCNQNDLVLSPAAFKALGVSLGEGRINIEWKFLDQQNKTN